MSKQPKTGICCPACGHDRMLVVRTTKTVRKSNGREFGAVIRTRRCEACRKVKITLEKIVGE